MCCFQGLLLKVYWLEGSVLLTFSSSWSVGACIPSLLRHYTCLQWQSYSFNREVCIKIIQFLVADWLLVVYSSVLSKENNISNIFNLCWLVAMVTRPNSGCCQAFPQTNNVTYISYHMFNKYIGWEKDMMFVLLFQHMLLKNPEEIHAQ